ncbi:MAG: hypothetical protein FJW40_03700 [Acidobacteria bacterium]|nr:hypothetical protein [Acidobacteriota bacterium]
MDSLIAASRLFEASIAAAPRRSSAWAGLARTYQLASDFDRRYAQRARDSAARAVALDARNPESVYMDGYMRFFEAWDFAGAERSFRQVIALNPRWEVVYRLYADAATLSGKVSEASAVLAAGRRLFPGSVSLQAAEAMAEYHQGHFDRMLALAKQMPETVDLTHWVRGLALEQAGDKPGARGAFNRCLGIAQSSLRCAFALLHLDASSRRVAEAEARAARLADGRGELCVAKAFLHAGLGDPARALDWIERGLAQHDFSVPWVLVDPRFAAVRNTVRFKGVQQQLSNGN